MKEKLIQAALKARTNAYAPYSRYQVGAALLTEDGEIITGCNVENASYGAACCAERTAVFKAVSEGFRNFSAIAVVGGADDDLSAPCRPCGACLQVLSEFCGDDFSVILTNGETKLGELMPMRFKL